MKMKELKMKLLLVCALVLFVGAPVALGHWDPGDGHKMHYPQLPDPTGWDVGFWDTMVMMPLELADDWQCSQTGPVEDIHFWVSWYYDMQGVIGSAMVSIYSNDPCGANGYSEPDELLWQKMFVGLDGIYYGDGDQGWYDPITGFYEPGNHFGIYQINITDIAEPFIQEEGQIYWLSIQTDTEYVGWKTSLDHFEDDATYRLAGDDTWYELYDPLSGESLDFAFVITGEPLDNDDCDNAEPVGDVTDLPFDTTAATFDGSGTCMTSPNIWYCYTATCTGVVTVSLCGSSYDTMLAVYDGCTCDPLGTELGCSDDYCDLQSQISFAATAGNEYLIEVGGYSSDTGQGLLSINCEPEEPELPKEPVPNLKWSQPPIEYDPTEPDPRYCGWDEVSLKWYDPCDPAGWWWMMAADDFRCFGSMPIDSIHWWGSYSWWDGDEPPDMAGLEPPIIGWQLGFWSNVPADPTGFVDYSYPEMLLWQVNVPAPNVQVERVGIDQHLINDGFPETCFQYYVDLEPDDVFWQEDFLTDTQDDVFWLSIAAVYDPCDLQMQMVEYPWGWKTRPWSWMDDGVAFDLFEDPVPGTMTDPCEMYPLEWNESYDLAFELDTDPNWIKWDQPFTGIRHWPHYEDVASWMEWWPEGIAHLTVAADDWQCQGPLPVTALGWWGSYWDYEYQPCDPCFVSTHPEPPAYFDVSIWTDVPADPCDQIMPWSHPGEMIWQYEAYDYDEVLVGYDKMPEDPCQNPQPGPHEPVFRYTARIPEEEWFWQDPNDSVYWLSIVAVYEFHYPQYVWGWTNHQHVYNDDAVQTPEMVDPDPAIPWQWYEIYDQEGNSADLSFTIYTDPYACRTCADFDDNGSIDLNDLRILAVNWLWTGAPGGYNIADLNCDGKIDYEDFAIFALQWLDSCP